MYARVYVEVTNFCNMSCSFCHGHRRAHRRMTAEEFARILAQLEGVTGHLYYHLMGEPLTHPALPQFLRMAKKKGFRSVITTNGTLLSRRGAELIEAGVHKVSVSLHSFEQGSEEEFFSYVNDVISFADQASRAGVIVVLRLWNRGFDEGRNEEILRLLRAALAGEWVENTRGLRIRDKLHIEWGDRFVWPDAEAEELGEEVFCYGLADHFGILADGTVVPCCMDSDGVIALGNVFDQELGEILAAPRACALREGFAERRATEDLCRRCAYARRFG